VAAVGLRSSGPQGDCPEGDRLLVRFAFRLRRGKRRSWPSTSGSLHLVGETLLYEEESLIADPAPVGKPRIPDWFQPTAARMWKFVQTGRAGTLIEQVYPQGSPTLGIEIPALHLGGWWDNVQRWQLGDWQAVQSAPAAKHQFLRMRAHDHEGFTLNALGASGLTPGRMTRCSSGTFHTCSMSRSASSITT